MSAGELDRLARAALHFQIGMAEEVLRNEPDGHHTLRFLAHAYTAVGRHQDGLKADLRLTELHPGDCHVRYNLACSLALTGALDRAFVELRRAIDLGFDDADLLRRDQDLVALHGDPRFDEILRIVAGEEGGRRS
ncbi:MAG: hypothetical protein ACE5JG_06675 [Planctomycetota bacterium]